MLLKVCRQTIIKVIIFSSTLLIVLSVLVGDMKVLLQDKFADSPSGISS